MAKNTIGPLPPEVPVLLVQGTDDTTVEPAVTKSYLGILCKGGSSAELHSMPGVGHITAARDGAPTAIAWMADRLAGKPAPSDCP
jgi:pimeloyl-ACP methyl ester carboxylesterase